MATSLPSLEYREIETGQCREKIRLALQEDGCLVVSNLLNAERCRAFHQVARDLLTLDSSILKLYRRKADNPNRGGYTPNGVEGVVNKNPSTSRHFFDFLPDTPTPPGEFEEVMGAAWKLLFSLGWTVMEAINPLLAKLVAGGEHHLRAAHYLNHDVDPNRVLFDPHVDWSLITIFVGGAEAGLSIKRNGVWQKVELGEEDLLIAPGTMLKQYDASIAPLRHRVMADSAERISLFFFMEPPKEVVLPSGEKVGDMLARLENKTRHDDPKT